MKIFVKILLTAILPGACPLYAAQIGDADFNSLKVSSLKIEKTDSRLYVDMEFDPSRLVMAGNREVCYTPMLVNGADTLRMKPFTIAGRNRYYNHLRNDAPGAPALYRAGETDSPMRYRYDAPLVPWMETASVVIAADEYGCCSEPKEMADVPVAQIDLTPKTFMPEYSYVVPKAEAVKMRSISARAYIDFPVNKTQIFPSYRRNPSELAKIRATIDSVRNDENLSITNIHIKGYASPEGSYANNARLAEGRTATLADYVRGLYHFDASVITTSFEPEDWAGLREYVASPSGAVMLTNRDALLTLITDPFYTGDDDAREAAIRKRFPKDYKFLLTEVYPGLRHSDYDVNYTIRSYTDPKEIIAMMRTAPQNLSLQEFFVAAQSQEPGSDLYNEAIELAVRMYPADPTANLNAACSAMQRNDLKSAERYLTKAGDSDEAQYARAILAAKQGAKEEAVKQLNNIGSYAPAQESARQLQHVMDNENSNFKMLNTEIKLNSN